MFSKPAKSRKGWRSYENPASRVGRNLAFLGMANGFSHSRRPHGPPPRRFALFQTAVGIGGWGFQADLDVLRAVVFGRGSLRLRGQWRSRRVRAVFSSPKHLLRAGRGNGQRADGGGVDSVDADGFLSVHGGAGLQRPPGNSASHDIADSSTPVETGPETRQATACRSRRGCVVSLFRAV